MPKFVHTRWDIAVKASIVALIDPAKLDSPESYGLTSSLIHHVIDAVLARMRPDVDPLACFSDGNVCMDSNVFRDKLISLSDSGHIRIPAMDRRGKLALHKTMQRVFCAPYEEVGEDEVVRHKFQTMGSDGTLTTCKCGNPSHVRVGSRGANNRDQVVEGTHGSSFGESNGNTRTADASVLLLRQDVWERANRWYCTVHRIDDDTWAYKNSTCEERALMCPDDLNDASARVSAWCRKHRWVVERYARENGVEPRTIIRYVKHRSFRVDMSDAGIREFDLSLDHGSPRKVLCQREALNASKLLRLIPNHLLYPACAPRLEAYLALFCGLPQGATRPDGVRIVLLCALRRMLNTKMGHTAGQRRHFVRKASLAKCIASADAIAKQLAPVIRRWHVFGLDPIPMSISPSRKRRRICESEKCEFV